MIKVGGEWLSSLEREDVIARHKDVAEVAVIGMPEINWDEIPPAVVVGKENAALNNKEIVQRIKESVDSGVLPREALLLKVQRTDAIEKNSVGKINKLALRMRFLEK